MAVVQESQSLLRRVLFSREDKDGVPPEFVPIITPATYLALAHEIARLAGEDPEGVGIVLADCHTATLVKPLERVFDGAATAVIFGDRPQGWPTHSNLIERPLGGLVRPTDHALLILSSTVSFTILGSAETLRDDITFPFQGGWSLQREHAIHALRVFLGVAAAEKLLGKAPASAVEATSASAMRLMALHANSLVSRHRDIVAAKDDLAAVLDILKAISAKRLAHDVLFVFVEQIAKAVSAKRCSIVRVWGEENIGRVLASHEDESIRGQDLDLDKYPELRQAMRTGKTVVINDVGSEPLTRPFADELAQADITSILVVPVTLFNDNVGSLFLRAARDSGPFTHGEMNFLEIVAEAAANALERTQLFEDIQAANKRLKRLSITDELTGLYNHRHFQERLVDEIKRARRYALSLSCLIFDIDNFKGYNDTYGHPVGDEILRQLAKCTRQTIRTSDFVARYGGEEFAIIMPQTDAQGAYSEGERLRKAIARCSFQGLPEGARVTVSAGVATLHQDDEMRPEDLVRMADEALYEAKRGGKNKVVVSRK